MSVRGFDSCWYFEWDPKLERSFKLGYERVCCAVTQNVCSIDEKGLLYISTIKYDLMSV